MAEACKSCKFYNSLFKAVGECRRYPPTVVGQGSIHAMNKRPEVAPTQWCGEYKLKPGYNENG